MKIYPFICVAILACLTLSASVHPTALIEESIPPGFIFTAPAQFSSQEASQTLLEMYQEIEELKKQNETIFLANDLYRQAEISYSQKNYTGVLKMAQLLEHLQKVKGEFLDHQELVKKKEKTVQQEGIDTTESHALLEQATASFMLDQLLDAQKFLEEADKKLEEARAERSRIKDLAELSKGFLAKHWWKILIALTVSALAAYPFVIHIVKTKRQKKVQRLRAELTATQGLIKELQKSCFIEKKITPNTYRQKAAKHEERIAEIRHTLPVIEALLQGKKEPPRQEKLKGILEVKR